MSRFVRFLIVAAAFGSLAPRPVEATVPFAPKLTVKNVQRIYHPSTYSDRKSYVKIATVASRKVFDQTDEYKLIAKRNISPTTAEWTLLVKAASDKFKSAISRAADDAGYDLVAEDGAVTLDDGVMDDATNAVIARLAGSSR